MLGKLPRTLKITKSSVKNMAQKLTDEETKSLKAKITDKKVIIGNDRVIKGIKSGNVKKVFLAKNCPSDVKEDLAHYADLSSIPLIELEQDNEEIGIMCKKNFLVSVIGVTEA
jgi:large subunit ribosomal protein L30e